MKKSFVGAARTAKRAYSPAVITEGGKTIWVAGHTGAVDDAGKSLAGDFDAQCRQTFRNIEKTLAETPAGKRANEAFEKLRKAKQAELDKHQGDLKKAAADLEKQAAVLKPDVLQAKKEELQKQFVALQQTYAKLEQDLAGERAKLIEELLKKAEPMIKEIAKGASATLVTHSIEPALVPAVAALPNLIQIAPVTPTAIPRECRASGPATAERFPRPLRWATGRGAG